MTQTMPMHVVEISTADGRRLVGPYRADAAEQVAQGARAGGATAEVLPLNLPPLTRDVFPAAYQWPPQGFDIREVASIYVDPAERWIVSAIASYAEDPAVPEIHDAATATQAWLGYLREYGDAQLFCFDRATGQTHCLTARDVDPVDGEPDPGTVPATISAPADASDQALHAAITARRRAASALEESVRPLLLEQITRLVRGAVPDADAIAVVVTLRNDREVLAADAILAGDVRHDPYEVLDDVDVLEELLAELTWFDGTATDRIELPAATAPVQ